MDKANIIAILKLAKAKKLPESIDSNSGFNLDIVESLIESGYLKAIDGTTFDGKEFVDPKITHIGLEYLESYNKENKWYSFSIKNLTLFTVLIALIGLLWSVIK